MRYADKETLMVFGTVDILHTIMGIVIAGAHIVMLWSYKCITTQEDSLIRFINENTAENDDTRAADTFRSTMPMAAPNWEP